jgi:hypothetical protein
MTVLALRTRAGQRRLGNPWTVSRLVGIALAEWPEGVPIGHYEWVHILSWLALQYQLLDAPWAGLDHANDHPDMWKRVAGSMMASSGRHQTLNIQLIRFVRRRLLMQPTVGASRDDRATDQILDPMS